MRLLETKYEGYLVGDDGYVYSTRYNKGVNDGTPKRLSLHGGTTSPYYQVSVNDKPGGKHFKVLVHSLVCETFNGDRPDGLVCSHINGDYTDNRPDNLVWESASNNLLRKHTQHNTGDSGYKNSRAALDQQQLDDVRSRLEAGERHQSIADDYGVSRTVITRIKSGTRYGRV